MMVEHVELKRLDLNREYNSQTRENVEYSSCAKK